MKQGDHIMQAPRKTPIAFGILLLLSLLLSAFQPAKNPPIAYGLSWYFTFEAPQTIISPSFQVVEVVNLWDANNNVIIASQTYPLACIESGDISYEHNGSSWLVRFASGSQITCQSTDLRQAGLALSQGAFDVCHGQQSCTLGVEDVFVDTKAEVNQTGPIFRYEQLTFATSGSAPVMPLSMWLQLGGFVTTSSVPNLQNGMLNQLEIRQANTMIRHWFNHMLIHEEPLTQPAFFSSTPQQILFGGQDAATGSWFVGALADGIFDPYSSGGYVR
ncbi:MAG: hypothetical protein R3C62_21195 [Chloroflexota bacterium]